MTWNEYISIYAIYILVALLVIVFYKFFELLNGRNADDIVGFKKK